MREPLCGPFLAYVVCVPPPPSSGVSLLQVLAILERKDIARLGPGDPEAWFRFAEASRLMYADRDRFVADPLFVEVPVRELLSADYLAVRAALIGTVAGPAPAAGDPAPIQRGLECDADDLARRAVIQALMCQFELRFDELRRSHGLDFPTDFATEWKELEAMEADGLLRLEADALRVMPRGRLLIRNICMVFDRRLREDREHRTYSRVI